MSSTLDRRPARLLASDNDHAEEERRSLGTLSFDEPGLSLETAWSNTRCGGGTSRLRSRPRSDPPGPAPSSRLLLCAARRSARNRPAWLAAIRAVRKADAVFWIQGHLKPPTPLRARIHAAARRPLDVRPRCMGPASRATSRGWSRDLHVHRCWVSYTEACHISRSAIPLWGSVAPHGRQQATSSRTWGSSAISPGSGWGGATTPSTRRSCATAGSVASSIVTPRGDTIPRPWRNSQNIAAARGTSSPPDPT